MQSTTAPDNPSEPTRPGIWAMLARIVPVLIAIQAARAAITILLYSWLRPTPSNPLWNWIDLAAYAVTGFALLVIFRPSVAALGLEWHGMSRPARVLSIGFCLLALFLLLASALLDPALLLENGKNAVMIPVFEELLFRGWVWSRLEATLKGKFAGALTWLVNSALFAIWHMGYFDIYLLKAFPASPQIEPGIFVIMKLAITFVIGLMVAFLRCRTHRAYGSLAMHMLINLFGR